MASEPSIGRMLFRGVDMVFLTVNGHQMLTLHEILEKLLPTTPRSTFCARIEKLNALRHACTKHETQKIKALGGAKRGAIKCTLIAREHVVEYCEKYMQNADANQGKSSSEGNECLQQGNGKASSIRNQFCPRSDHGAATEKELVFANDERTSQPMLEDLVQYKSNANEVYMENIGNVRDTGETQTETKVLSKENGNSEKLNARFKKQNIRYSKLSGVMSWSGATGAISQQRNINQRSQQRASKPRPSQVLKIRGTASRSDFVRKLERKTNLELVQTSCGKIVDDNVTVKRPKTSHHVKGNGSDAKEGHQTSIDDSSSALDFPASSSLSLTALDLATYNSKRSRDQDFQLLNDEVYNDESIQTAKCYLDDNNNEIEILHKPLSPTLLLKRSVNNEWQVAKSKSSTARLNFDNEEVTLNDDDTERFLEAAETRKAHSTNFTNSITINDTSLALATVPKPSPITASTQSTKTLTSKVKKSVAVRHVVSTKKNGGITGMKSETKAFKSDEQERNTNKINRFGSDVLAKDKTSGAKFIGNGCSSGVKSVEPNRSANNSNGKSLAGRDTETKRFAKPKSKYGLQQLKTNKTNGGIVKQKRRRRVQLNTFRLIETIPYPSLLVVKDGDLCPSYTMTYSAAKCLPHCCHPLWRWHLGKPILNPKGFHVGKSS